MANCPACSAVIGSVNIAGYCSWACKTKGPAASGSPVPASGPPTPTAPAQPTVKSFLEGAKYAGPAATSVAAALVNGDELHYFESPHTMIPAAAYMLNCSTYKNKDLFTNLAPNNWILEYTKRSVRHTGQYRDSRRRDVSAKQVQLKPIASLDLPPLLTYPDNSAPLAGGLYDAAKAAVGRKALPDRSTVSVNEKLLRYYMLAAYSLVAMSAEMDYEGLGNHVGTIMVDDNGKIIAAGVNTGYYRHAEVTTLIDYFSKNSGATKFPERTIVFSTLTPCEQCTKYLETSAPTESVIYFGQLDTGSSGKAGLRLGPALSSVTKAPRGVEKVREEIAVTDSDADPSGVASTITRTSIHKTQLSAKLSSCVDSGQGNIAKQITQSAVATATMRSAADSLIRKAFKARGDGEDDAAKSKVLQYLTSWLAHCELG